MDKKSKFRCPCCGYKTLELEPPGSFDICPVCFWEDDNLQFDNPNLSGGANRMSLNEARENYKKFSAKSADKVELVRKPYEEEK